MTRLAEILKKELEAQGMTQQDLADAVGTTQPAIFKILKGTTKKPRILPDIASALNVSTDYLLGLEPRQNNDISKNPRFERIKALFGQLDEKDIDKGIDYLETLAANKTLKRFRDTD